MNEPVSEQPLSPKVAAYVGIDWADQKHDVVLRSAGDPAKPEHQVIKNEINALNDWIAQIQERFGTKGKVLVCLEQSRGALIYQLMAYELFELLQFGHFETVKPGEILDFSLGKSFLFFCWPRDFVRCSDVRKWSHYIFRAVR